MHRIWLFLSGVAASIDTTLFALVIPTGIARLYQRRGLTYSHPLKQVFLLGVVTISLFGVTSLVHGKLDENLYFVAIALLIFFVIRSGIENKLPVDRVYRRGLIVGWLLLITWLIITSLLGSSRATVPLPGVHPNLAAHSLVVLTGIIFVTQKRTSIHIVSSIATFGAVLLTGSKSGLLAFGVLILWALCNKARPRSLLVAITILVTICLGLVAVNPQVAWYQRTIGTAVQLLTNLNRTNLLHGSEELDNPDYWQQLEVSVSNDHGVPASPNGNRDWTITREGTASWARLQQSVRIQPGVYTLSAEFHFTDGAAPGFLIWTDATRIPSELRAFIDDGGAWVADSGGFEEIGVQTLRLDDGWQRLIVTFEVRDSLADIPLAAGLGPALSNTQSRAEVMVRKPQLEHGYEASAYRASPGSEAELALSARFEARSRLQLWSFAIEGWLSRPLVGWGYGSFADNWSQSSSEANVAGHAHNIFLTSLYESGLVGTAAATLFLVSFWGTGGPIARTMIISLLIANLVDSTMLNPVVLSPLAFLTGVSTKCTRPVDAVHS